MPRPWTSGRPLPRRRKVFPVGVPAGTFRTALAFQRGHFHFAAQGRAGEADRYAAEKIGPFALENFVRFHVQDDVEIARRTAARAALALAAGTKARAIFHARRES